MLGDFRGDFEAADIGRAVHRGRYFICRYFGAEFLVRA
jgi:hypothetical protein